MASAANFASILLLLWGSAASVEGKPICANTCAATWKKCAGEGIPAMKACCDENDVCVFKNSGYSQCRPKAQPLPKAWKGAKIITCKKPGTPCDVSKITQEWNGAEIHDKTHLVGKLYPEQCEEYGYPHKNGCCHERCEDLKNCYAYMQTVEDDCYFYDAGVISKDTRMTPWIDATINFMRCFTPEPLCDPATREVREVNAQKGDFFEESHNSDYTSIILDKAYAFEACINFCAMSPLNGGCTHFALDEYSKGELLCTPLFAKSDRTANYEAQKTSRVWSIENCD